MQPYFAPYEGYFRLFSHVDLFVAYDCVQFPRRGWVHRNQLLDCNGSPQWLTLPLERADFETKIKDLRFGAFSRERMDAEMRRFPAFDHLPPDIVSVVEDARGSFVQYVVEVLEACCDHLRIPHPNLEYSSALEVPESYRGQDRILEICRRYGAKKYINPPGGRALYDADAFADAGIELEFLPEWTGNFLSILQVLADRERANA